MKRVILITTGDILASIACKNLFQDLKKNNFRIVAVINSNISFKKSICILLSAIKNSALLYALYIFIEAYGLKIVNNIHYIYRLLGFRNKFLTAVFDDSKNTNIPVIRIKDVNSYDSISAIKAYNADLILCVRPNQILKRNFITSFPRVLNLHCTLLPKYRGIGGILQALSNKESELGCTVYVINSEEIDYGPVVIQSKLLNDNYSSLLFCTIKLYKEAKDLLPEAINLDATIDHAMLGNGSYSSWPKKKDLSKFLLTGRKFFTLSDFKFFDE